MELLGEVSESELWTGFPPASSVSCSQWCIRKLRRMLEERGYRFHSWVELGDSCVFVHYGNIIKLRGVSLWSEKHCSLGPETSTTLSGPVLGGDETPLTSLTSPSIPLTSPSILSSSLSSFLLSYVLVIGIEPRTLYMLGKCSTSELSLRPEFFHI